MHVRLDGNNLSTRWTCCVCGGDFQLAEASAILYSDDGEPIGDICPQCLGAGAAGAAERARAFAEKLRGRIQEVRELARQQDEIAERLATGALSLPRRAALDAKLKEVLAEAYGLPPEALVV